MLWPVLRSNPVDTETQFHLCYKDIDGARLYIHMTKSSTVLDRVQKTPEGHVDDVSVPSRRPEHNRQLDTEAWYRWGSNESRWWLYTWCSHVRQGSGCQLHQATVKHSTSQNVGCCIHVTFQFVGDDLWSPSEDNITIVHPWRCKGVDEWHRRLCCELPAMSEPTK